jgi:uncharacterized membrane protein
MILLDIFTFLGRMHPLIVHLPIGFLLLALIFDGASYFKRYAHLSRAVPFSLLVGFAFAAIACVLGYMLSLTGDYDDQVLSQHRLSGISLTITAGVLYILTTARLKRFFSIPRSFFSGLALIAFFLLSYTGHLGANLTHGNNYITLETLLHQPREKPTRVEEAWLFEDIVQPILAQRCFQCHRADKKKGKLSMENLAMMLEGGKHGPAVVPGDLSGSELFRRITLDPAHEDFMPTDGKTPLTQAETEIIRWWIEKGMAAEGQKLASIDNYEEIMPLASSVLGLSAPAGYVVGTSSVNEHANTNIPDLTDMTPVDNLRKKGLRVRLMQHQPVMLDVTLPAGSGKKITDFENELQSVAANIIWLNLSDNDFTDADLTILQQMSNLEKLRLQKNPVSDDITRYLGNLEHLEAVNLNETRLTNAGLTRLKQNPAIRRIYSWRTQCDSARYSRQ